MSNNSLIRKTVVLILMFLSFSTYAKFSFKQWYRDLCATKTQQDQDDCVTLVNKKLDQISKKYAHEFDILSQSISEQQQAKLNLMIINKVQSSRYFTLRDGDTLYNYRRGLQRNIKALIRFKKGRFLGNQQILNSNSEVANALNWLNQIQAKLQQIDNYIRHDARFIETVENVKFWAVVSGVIIITVLVGVGLVCAGLCIWSITATFVHPKTALWASQVFVPVGLVGSIVGLGGGTANAVSLNKQVKELNLLINQEDPLYV